MIVFHDKIDLVENKNVKRDLPETFELQTLVSGLKRAMREIQGVPKQTFFGP